MRTRVYPRDAGRNNS